MPTQIKRWGVKYALPENQKLMSIRLTSADDKAETTALIQGGGLINFIVKGESIMYIQTTGTTKWNPKCFGELEDYGQRKYSTDHPNHSQRGED